MTGRRGEARAAAIMAAALELVAEVGYERVTIDAVAARAQASKATIYKRWAGKPELVAEGLRNRAQGPAPEVPDTGSLRGDLLATVAEIAGTLTGGSGPSLIGLVDVVRDDPDLRRLVSSQVRRRCHEVGATIAQRALMRGEYVDGAMSDLVLELAFDRIFTSTLLAGRPPPKAQRTRLVDDVLLPLITREDTT